MKKLAVFLALLLMLGTVPAAMAESTGLGVVTTAFGDVSGVYENGVTYYKGVPYAAPPVGGLRWAAPVDPEPWDGVLACDEYAPMAMQILSTTDWWGEEFYYDWLDEYPPMSEDCLYLNVVTPAASSDDSYPVFVWFHGGAGMHGYSWEPEFEPSELAKKGVIVVSVGYRLGLFGYMALEELSEASPTGTSGNYGLLDQIKSLEWVQQNIAAFGGDPSRVTIGGQSAGASAVTAILTSPLSKGLVTGAIMNSSFGAFGSSVTSMEDMYANCNAYLDEKGYGEMTLEELRALPTSAFINETTEKPEIYGKGFGRCLDGWSVTETPIDFFLREGSLEGINLLYGSNSGEGNGSFTISTQEDIFASAKGTYGGLYDKYNFEGLYKGTDDIGATLESLRLRSERGGMQSIIIAEVLSQTQPGSNLYPYYFDHWTPAARKKSAGPGIAASCGMPLHPCVTSPSSAIGNRWTTRSPTYTPATGPTSSPRATPTVMVSPTGRAPAWRTRCSCTWAMSSICATASMVARSWQTAMRSCASISSPAITWKLTTGNF